MCKAVGPIRLVYPRNVKDFQRAVKEFASCVEGGSMENLASLWNMAALKAFDRIVPNGLSLYTNPWVFTDSVDFRAISGVLWTEEVKQIQLDISSGPNLGHSSLGRGWEKFTFLLLLRQSSM